jgi:hypothetical protein
MASSHTEVLLPVTTQSLFDTQTDTTIFPSVSNFQDETPCPPSNEFRSFFYRIICIKKLWNYKIIKIHFISLCRFVFSSENENIY